MVSSYYVDRLVVAAALLTTAGITCMPTAEAAIVEASTLTTVAVEAPLYDAALGAQNGCDPVGCVGNLTRDGDAVGDQSRWSCKPALDAAGSSCSITYTLGDEFIVEALEIALRNGDTQTRHLEIYIDGNLFGFWSSGNTADFERVNITGTRGQTVELRQVPGDQGAEEWISIMEVEILVDDGSYLPVPDNVVEAGTLGMVLTKADIFDERIEADGGCPPDGCRGSNTRDGSTTGPSRWSCTPTLGGTCIISYDLGAVRDLAELRIYMYRGTTRKREFEVYVDGLKVSTWTSSGTTDGPENINIMENSGQVISIKAVLLAWQWTSVVEVEIMVIPPPEVDSVTPAPAGNYSDPPPTSADDSSSGTVPVTRTAEDGRLVVEAGEIAWVDWTHVHTISHDTRPTADGGCDPRGCDRVNTRDGSLDPNSRWACQYEARDFDFGIDWMCRVAYSLDEARDLDALRVAFYEGDTSTKSLAVYVDDVLVVEQWTSSGDTLDFQSIPLYGFSGENIALTALLDDGEWIGITEVEIDIIVDDVPIVGVSALDRITPTVTATSAGDPSALQDGVIGGASSWSCSGVNCSVTFDLQANQAVEQISMAFVEEANDTAANIFDLSIAYSSNGNFLPILSGTPSNKDRPLSSQQWKIDHVARFVKIQPSSAGSGALHISEVDFRLSETVPLHPDAIDSDLSTVGLLPAPRGSGEDSRTAAEGGCDPNGCLSFYAKDGSTSTHWQCYGNPTSGGSTYYPCSLSFNLWSYRHIKKIRIALPDGRERAVEMRITARKPNYSGDNDFEEMSVISSGETDGFETYDFDHFTNHITISGKFRIIDDIISISEVEFQENVETGVIPIYSFDIPRESGDGLWDVATTDGFEWQTASDEAVGLTLGFKLAYYATVSAIQLKFPVGVTYQFDATVHFVNDNEDSAFSVQGLQSNKSDPGFQSFPLAVPQANVAIQVDITMRGTVGGGSGFKLLDARVMGSAVENPTDITHVGSVRIEDWNTEQYPDFVAEGTGDQRAIMGAICKVKSGAFDGVDCADVDDAATGTVHLPSGEWHVDGSIFMESGVYLKGRFSGDDSTESTNILLTEGASGSTTFKSIVVFNEVSDAQMEDVWIRGLYDPVAGESDLAVDGSGLTCLEITDSKNVTCKDVDIRYCDGDGLSVLNSSLINIDAGKFDDDYLPWTIGENRGTGIMVDNSDAVWIRRHTVYNNSLAGIHLLGSNNFTFEATIDSGSEGEGNVGSLDGQQPIEVVVEGSSLVTFQDMKVTSNNDPVMVVSADSSLVTFNNCGFSSVEAGICVIEAEDPSVVTAEDDELNLVGNCYVKVDSDISS